MFCFVFRIINSKTVPCDSHISNKLVKHRSSSVTYVDVVVNYLSFNNEALAFRVNKFSSDKSTLLRSRVLASCLRLWHSRGKKF